MAVALAEKIEGMTAEDINFCRIYESTHTVEK
jgi:hypothetical protein